MDGSMNDWSRLASAWGDPKTGRGDLIEADDLVLFKVIFLFWALLRYLWGIFF